MNPIRLIVRLGLGLALLNAPSLTWSAPQKAPIISRITIRGTNVFDLDTKTYLRKFPYTWVNFLHIQTREHVIRRTLLFKEGDRLDRFLLRETERNLRAYSYITAARIATFPQRDGTVAVVVHVSDSWTTEPQINMGGVNDVNKFEIGFKERNFLGLGKTIEYFYNKTDDITENRLGYFDPNVLGTRWQFRGDDIEASNGHDRFLKLERPYYAADVRWSAGTSHNRSVRVKDAYENNVIVSEYEHAKEVNEFLGSRKLNKSRHVVHRAGLRYQRESNNFENTPNTAPDDPVRIGENYQTVFLDWYTIQNKYIEAIQLEKMSRVEDINLGFEFSVSPGYAPRQLTGQSPSSQFVGTVRKFTRIRDVDFLFTEFSHSSRNTFKKSEDQFYRATVKYYNKDRRRQTLVAHARAEWSSPTVDDNPIVLGNENGLRAFESSEFRGEKSLLFNLENRSFFIDDLWEVFALGSVVFFDAGYAWERERSIHLNDFKSDIGAGLRIGLTKSSNEVLVRLDVSYRLQTTRSDDAKWVFTFGSGHAF